MTQASPLVSILIRTKDRPDALIRCVKSVLTMQSSIPSRRYALSGLPARAATRVSAKKEDNEISVTG